MQIPDPRARVIVALVLCFASPLEIGAQDSDSPSTETPRFALSTTCALCHSNSPRATAMRDANGRGIAPFDLWRASSMANSARDPIFRAVLSAEIAAAPRHRAAIEAKCLRCHAPMGSRVVEAEGVSPSVVQLLDSGEDGSAQSLSHDGVSCTTCHRMAPESLGDPTTFSGHWRVAAGNAVYGPHASPFWMPMLHHTGFQATEGAHVREAALCSSCHTLRTAALDAHGEATGGSVLEQAPYLEWQASGYSTEVATTSEDARTCQDCHVPTTDVDGVPIVTRIVRNPGGRNFPPTSPRSPYGRHTFLGGNTLLPALLRDHRQELGVAAPRASFDLWIEAVRHQLSTRTARLSIGDWTHDDGRLEVPLRIENLTGHKLPTGYPARRVWLEVTVRDREGRTLIHSGAHDERGRLVDESGEPLASERAGGPIPAHRSVLAGSDEVLVWQAILADDTGEATFRLLRGAGYAKDNRLLPRGWSPERAASLGVEPVGTERDDDFSGGGDTVRVRVRTIAEAGPWTIEARLLYQPIAPRFLDELRRFDTPEVRRLERLLGTTKSGPELIAEARSELKRSP